MSNRFEIGDNNNVNFGGTQNIGNVFAGSSSRGYPESMPGMPDRPRERWGEPIVFINYRNPDEKAAADLEAELTRRLGQGAVFRDVRMYAGTEFTRELTERAARCKVMLSIIGERWDDPNGLRLLRDPTDWVRREIAIALAHRVHVVPVMVGARGRLKAAELPADIRGIAYLQAPHLRSNYDGRDVQRLVEELMRDLAVQLEAVFRGR